MARRYTAEEAFQLVLEDDGDVSGGSVYNDSPGEESHEEDIAVLADDIPNLPADWAETTVERDQMPQEKAFIWTPGINPAMSDGLDDTIGSFIDLFFTDGLLNHIVFCTNNCAEKHENEDFDMNETPHSRAGH